MAHGVELERPDDDPAGGVGGRAGRVTERHAQAGVEFLHAEGLGDVVVGATLQRRHLLALLVAPGEDDDGRRRIPPHAADDREAIHVRQA